MRFYILLVLSCVITIIHGQSYYWVGGTGSWSNGSHWSSTSGGPAIGTSPGVGALVYFDANSGLTNASVVTLDAAINVSVFNFSAATSAFQFSTVLPFIEVTSTVAANPNPTFGAWFGFWKISNLGVANIQSNGRIWANDFQFSGSALVNAPNFQSSADVYLNSGSLSFQSTPFQCSNFFSLGSANRTLNMTGSTVTLTGTSWNFGGTNYFLNASGSHLLLTNLAATMMNGSNLIYNEVRAVNGPLNIYGKHQVAFLKSIPLGNTIRINNGDTLSIDSLFINGNCSNKTSLRAINSVGATAKIIKGGHPLLRTKFLSVNHLNAINSSGQSYLIALSDTVNQSAGWQYIGAAFYWIGNSGNYTNPAHWSLSSGGIATSCLPTILDSIYFDALSFSLPYQQVNFNGTPEFAYMNWSAINQPTVGLIQANVSAYGDVILDAQLSLNKATNNVSLLFRAKSSLTSNSSLINTNVSVVMVNALDSLKLTDPLNMTDTVNFSVFNGGFNTMSFAVNFGYFSVNNQLATTFQRVRFGNSQIHIARNFTTVGASANFQFFAGNSMIYIGSLSSENNLRTSNLTFNEVTLSFPKYLVNMGAVAVNQPQKIEGNNVFKKLRILAGSYVQMQGASTQTILDSLILNGNCQDSIYLYSSNSATPSLFVKNTPGNVTANCVNFMAVGASGSASFTAYFSTNSGPAAGVANWNLSATPAVNASFNAVGPFCYNDTTFFTNNSTGFSGNPNDVSYLWYFGDGTNSFYADSGYVGIPTPCTPCAGDSVLVINGVPDTNAHIFAGYGSFNVMLIAEYANFCVDTAITTIQINNPDIFVICSDADTTICQGTAVTFDIGSSNNMNAYAWYLNGNLLNNPPSSNDTLYQTSSIQNNDTLSFASIEGVCVSSAQPTFVFTVNPVPVTGLVSNDLDNTICAQTPITFTASGAQLYRFLVNNVPVTPFSANTTFTTSSLSNGAVVKVIGKYTATGCLDTSNAIIVTVNSLPSVALAESSGSNVICAGQSVTFSASGASTYQFFVNNSPATPIGNGTFTTLNLASFDTVEVVGYSSAGCVSSSLQSFGYIVNPLPNISLTFNDLDTSICQGTNVTFNAGGGVLYQFYLNGVPTGPLTSTNSFSSNALSNNDVLFAQGYFNGCTNASDTVVFEVLPQPTTQLISNDLDSTVCQGSTVIFNASGASSYEFFVAGVSQGPSSPVSVFSTNNLSNGQTVSVVGTTNGCSVSDQIPFTILPLPNVPIFSNNPQNTLCSGQSIGLISAGAVQYQLMVNGNPFGAQQVSPSFNPILPVGTNTLYIQGVGANTCSSNSSILTVQVNPIPTITLQSSDLDNIFCVGDNVSITAFGANQYQFFLNGVSQGNLTNNNVFASNSFSNGQTITVLGSSLGCTALSAPMTFTVNPIPAVTITSNDPNNIFCQGDNITYQASGATTYSLVLNGQLLAPPGPLNTVAMQFYPPGNYQLQVSGTANGCTNQSAVNIQINPNPTVSLSASVAGNTLCSGQNVTMTASGAAQYQFQLNGNNLGVLSGLNTLQLNNLASGDIVSVVGTSNLGCVNLNTLPAFTVNQTPQTNLTSSELDLALCIGTPVLFTASGASTYEFFVNGISQGPASVSPSLTLSNLQDNDLVQVLGFNQNCSDYSPTLLFNVYNYPNVSISNQGGSQICVGQLVNASASGANNYQFFVNSQPVGPSSNNNNFTGSLNNGDTLTVLGETFGCSAFAVTPISLIVYPYPLVTSVCNDLDLTICLFDTVYFTATGAMTYEFTQNSNPPIAAANGQFSTNGIQNGDTIFVQGFNGTCPSAIDTFVFNVNSMVLNLTSQPAPLICNGTNISFQANGGSSYQFYVNGIPQGLMNVSGVFNSTSLQDDDKITFTAFNSITGCYQPFLDSILLDVIPNPIISYNTPLVFCEGDSVILLSNFDHNNIWEMNGAITNAPSDSSLVVNQSAQVVLSQNSSVYEQTYSFGYNANGMFGNANNQSSNLPVEMQTNLWLKEISSGWNFSIGLTATGQVYAWGNNSTGQLGNGTYTSTNVPALMPSLSNINSIATSENSAMALSSSGGVYVWGNNTYGQLGTGNASVYNFPFLNPAFQNMDTICGGRRHFLCLRNDGKVFSIGNNSYGQLGIGNLNSTSVPVQIQSLSGIAKIGVGEFHSFAIDSSGNMFVWGNNASGQLGLGDHVNRVTPTISSVKNVVQVNGGADFTVMLKQDGTVWSTGKNNFGQLGLNDVIDRDVPEKVGITGVYQIACGQYYTLLLRKDYSVFGFGDNTEGQLTSASNAIAPVHIADLHGTVFIEAGKSTSHAINGLSTSCSTLPLSIVVNVAPIPSITINSGVLSTNAVGITYQWYFGGQEILNNNAQSYLPSTPGYYSVAVTYPNGCTAVSAPFPYLIQELDEVANTSQILYPVPANEVLIIEALNGSHIANFKILDASGRILWIAQGIGESKHFVEVNSFSEGTYFVAFENGETLRFVVAH